MRRRAPILPGGSPLTKTIERNIPALRIEEVGYSRGEYPRDYPSYGYRAPYHLLSPPMGSTRTRMAATRPMCTISPYYATPWFDQTPRPGSKRYPTDLKQNVAA
jgi:hypothetical protein